MVYKVDTKVEINSSLTTKEKQIANGLKEKNIFIYKGYCYDEETRFFAMGHRYNISDLCQSIQSDNIEYLNPSFINGLNLYCYYFNNPIIYIDSIGHFAISTFLIEKQ